MLRLRPVRRPVRRRGRPRHAVVPAVLLARHHRPAARELRVRVDAPEGFSPAVPEGRRREDKGGGQLDRHGPTGPGQLRGGIVEKADRPSCEHFQELEKAVGRQEGHRRLRLTRNIFKGRPGALWEWTWEDRGRPMRAVGQAYVDGSGTECAILFQGRAGMGPRATWLRTSDTALTRWRAGKR
ncbi:hypothetical protein I5Q34_12325 [Streptomyces sp. AV19]|uniref:hypothetical protein n=1 Tax=Streptomyces sp. AV19 TaxID=2793068 RepID=UPI0018FEBCA1|nr:hypothetical protein [Streptomyces sp. AV19]MBH1935054.1 hypothetical protein [Streptomyces sp. AV19]MDG4530987.1 hypothetical protein [Streptomyces sp. AV19]